MTVLSSSYNRIAVAAFIFLTRSVAGNAESQTPLQLGPRKDVRIESRGDGISELTATGPTPHFWSQPVEVPADHNVLAFGYFSVTGVESISVRFRDANGEMVFVGSRQLPIAESWQPFAIELSALPKIKTRFHISLKARAGTSLQLRSFRLRQRNEEELRSQKRQEEVAAARATDATAFLGYLNAEYPAEIENVDVGIEDVRITGQSTVPVKLAELPVHARSHRSAAAKAHVVSDHQNFSIVLPRFAGKDRRDRAVSRWQLVTEQGGIASLAKWPTQTAVSNTDAALPKAVAKSRKGIGGVPNIASDDHPIFELGVHHATVNFVLDAVLSKTKSPGRSPWQFEGRTYFVNDRFLAGKDRTIRKLCEHDIVVTCILLVGNSKHGQLKHPEAESRGTFAMPDLTTEASAHHYRAAIHFLANRYANPRQRIANWVIHNEVDQAGTWTNMGNQPLPRYLETYHRSARIVYHTARQFDPHARIFISLTHHWAKRSSGHGTYTVRDLIELWSKIASAEGDFDWGVAYHPYPQDLRNPDTWNDRDVTFDINTPYITPKNIEVLPRFLGADRPIILSEQGFNTPTLSQSDQQRQADALTYMFDKLKNLPTIEAFHLHRYQDMPDREGGLRLGIMDENGNRKLGWHTYQKLTLQTASD